MKTIKLDSDHDILVENYSPVFLTDQDYIAEKLRTKFLLFKGEYYLDILKGVPYYQHILKKNPDVRMINNIFKKQALEITGVTKVIDLNLEFSESLRLLTIEYSLDTVYGTISGVA